MVSRVNHVLVTNLAIDEDEIMVQVPEQGLGNPYQQYAADDGDDEKSQRRKSSSKRAGLLLIVHAPPEQRCRRSDREPPAVAEPSEKMGTSRSISL